jgi:secreted Zn-dependent insulinase-like peptidase
MKAHLLERTKGFNEKVNGFMDDVMKMVKENLDIADVANMDMDQIRMFKSMIEMMTESMRLLEAYGEAFDALMKEAETHSDKLDRVLVFLETEKQ